MEPRLSFVTLGVARARRFYEALGRLWEVACNPFMPLDAAGRVVLPYAP